MKHLVYFRFCSDTFPVLCLNIFLIPSIVFHNIYLGKRQTTGDFLIIKQVQFFILTMFFYELEKLNLFYRF